MRNGQRDGKGVAVRKVLVVTYYFPPSGGPGVQRPLKFVRYLREFGWDPVVLTVRPEEASWPGRDPGLESDVPPGVEVIRTRALDPYAAYARFTGRSRDESVGVGFLSEDAPGLRERFARWVRANLFLPDARVGWVGFATRAGRDRVRRGDIDAVVTTGPPQSTHLAGRRIASASTLPWLADLRDLWPDPAYADDLPMTAWARRRDERLRDRTLGEADEIMAVTEGMVSDLEKTLNRRVHLLPNGYDPSDFEGVRPHPSDGFTVLHAGNLSPARNPEALWRVLSKAVKAGAWPELKVDLVGSVDASVRESIERFGLSHIVRHTPMVPHDEAVARMLGADVLLLPINHVRGATGIVTGKLFEYLAARRPILCIGPTAGEAAAIIEETDAGVTAGFEDADRIELVLTSWYHAWEAGRPVSGSEDRKVERYSRREQTGRLAAILDDLVGSPASVGTAGD